MAARRGIGHSETAGAGSARESDGVAAAPSRSLRHAGDFCGVYAGGGPAGNRVSHVFGYIVQRVNSPRQQVAALRQLRIRKDDSRSRPHSDIDNAVNAVAAFGGVRHREASRALNGLGRDSKHAAVPASAAGYSAQLCGVYAGGISAGNRIAAVRLAHIIRSINHLRAVRADLQASRPLVSDSRRRAYLNADSAALRVAAAGGVRHNETSRTLNSLGRNSKHAAAGGSHLRHRHQFCGVNIGSVPASNRVGAVCFSHIGRSVNRLRAVRAHLQPRRRVESDI